MKKKHLRFNITRYCNLNCEYCFIERREEHMDFEFIKEITKLHKPKYISISGGEPLIHPNFNEIVLFFLNERCNIHIVTNCTLLQRKEYFFKSISKNYDCYKLKISLSYDGLKKPTYEHIKFLKGLNFRVGLFIYPNKEVVIDLDNILKTCAKLELEPQLLFPVPLGNNCFNFMDKETWGNIIKKYVKIARKLNLVSYYQPSWSEFKKYGIEYSNQQNGFAVDNSHLYECCLFTEKVNSNYNIENLKCGLKYNNSNNKGCVMLINKYKEDYRSNHSEELLCPLTIYKVTND